MKKVFVVKEGTTLFFVWVFVFFMFLYFAVQTQLTIAWILMIFISLAVSFASIQYLIWAFTGFAVKIDFEQKEITLNNTFWFYKKQIPLEDVLAIQIEKANGYLVVSKSVNLTKQQKRISKKNEDFYSIPLANIPVDTVKLLKEVLESSNN